MTAVVVTKGQDGKLAGMGEKGGRAYAKFLKRVKDLATGDTLHFEWREPRSLPHHRLFFGKVNALLDIQEQFDDADKLRQWLTVGAGYCDFVPGPTGRMVALPQSIAFHKLEEPEFAELHSQVDGFMWTLHARRFLWPQMSDEQSYAMVEQFMERFL